MLVAVGEVEVVDVAPELPLHLSPLAAAKKVRLIQSDEPAQAGALAHGSTEVDVAGPLFLHVEHNVHIALLATRACLRGSHRRLEEIQVADVLVAADQIIAVEQLARGEDDLLPDARLVGVIVADDLDSVHDRGRSLVDLPAQVDLADGVGARHPLRYGMNLSVDVALVVVSFAQLSLRLFPASRVEGVRRVDMVAPDQAGSTLCQSSLLFLAERIECRPTWSVENRRLPMTSKLPTM